MFTSSGILKYSVNPYNIVVLLDGGLAAYYRALLPRSVVVQPPMHQSHISVVRRETPVWKCYWGLHSSREVSFTYDPFIYMDDTYCWVKVWSDTLCDIREELGLPKYRYIAKLDGDVSSFHITIGNFKHRRYNEKV